MAKKKFPLEIPIRAIDGITKPLRRMQGSINRFWKPVRTARTKLQELVAVSGLTKLNKRIHKLGTGALRLGRALGKAAKKTGLLIAAGVGGGIAFFRSYARAGDDVIKTSRKLGIGVEALQELRFAAESSGVPIATFDMAMQRMGRRVGEAAHGMGEARGALAALGIEVRDAEGNVRSIESLLPEVAEGLSKVKTENERNALAMKLFDSEGVALVNMLGDGADAMEKMREQSRLLGNNLTLEQALAAEKAQQNWTNLTTALTGARNSIFNGLTPALTKLTEKLTILVVKYQPKIEAWASKFAENLPERIEKLKAGLEKFKNKLKGILGLGASLADRFGGVNIILAVLAAVIFGPVIGALASLIPIIYSLGAALLATPIGWIIIGLTLLVGGFIFLYKKVGFFRTFWDAVWAGIVAVFKWTWGWIKKIGGWMAGWVTWSIDKWKGLLQFFKDLWGGIKGIFSSGVSWVGDKLKSMVGWLPDWVTKKLGFSVEANVDGEVTPPNLTAAEAAALSVNNSATVRVEFAELPTGARVEERDNSGIPMELDMGFSSPAL